MDAENVIALSAAVIALAALGVSVWQGILGRRQFMISVRPLLRLDWHTNSKTHFAALRLKNSGLGPAVITRFCLIVDQEIVEGSGLQMILKAFTNLGLPGLLVGFHCLEPGEAVSPEETLEIIRPQGLSKEEFSVLKDQGHRLSVRVDYRSVCGEEFTVSSSRPGDSLTPS